MRKLLGLAAILSLAGCAGSAPQYYSLQSGDTASVTKAGQVQADYVVSIQPVLIPQQVARPQIVVGGMSDEQVVPLNAALWAGPLEAQIRDTVSALLVQRLNVLDIGQSRPSGNMPVWQIYLDVQRFDSFYDRAVRQDIVWRLVPQGMPTGVGRRVCSAQVRLSVGTGMSALVQGHREGLAHVADLVSQTLPWPQDVSSVDTSSLPDEVNFRGCVDVKS